MINQNELNRLNFHIQKKLHTEMLERMIITGYGVRKVSPWVSEALTDLVQRPNFIELIQISNSMGYFNKKITVICNDATNKLMDKAVIDVRSKFPAMEGVKSRILRTAIIQRLLRE